MTQSTRTFHVRLITRSFYEGAVDAASADDAVELTYRIWRTECPHPFQQCDDDELMDVLATEAQS
jgi:hypothetical protein